MNRSRWLWSLLIAGVVVYFATRGGGPEAEIRDRLAEVEELLEKSSGEASLASVDRANRLAGHLSEEFTVAIEPYGQSLSNRQQLIRSFVGFRHAYDSIAVGLELQNVQVTGNRAETSVRATFFGTGGGGGPSREAWDVKILWRDEGGWKMEDVRVVGRAEGLL